MNKPPLTQTRERKTWFQKNEIRLRREQGCLTDCVAYLLNLHPRNVPYFVYPRKGWNERLKAFFKKHGYEVHWRFAIDVPKRGTHILCGDSKRWKTSGHVVVYKNGKIIYDPSYPSDWDDKRITHRLVVRKTLPT